MQLLNMFQNSLKMENQGEQQIQSEHENQQEDGGSSNDSNGDNAL